MGRNACWENAFSVVEPQINAAGVHRFSFDPSFPIDVRYLVQDERQGIRMNRHDYLEIVLVLSGGISFAIQDRILPLGSGDLIVIGPDVRHTSITHSEGRLACLYFSPDLIWSGDQAQTDAEYLLPFFRQGSDFPHVIRRNTGVPAKVFHYLRRVQAELPAVSSRAKLTVRTYLKFILVLLLNHYASHLGALSVMDQKERALNRLRPIFEMIESRYQETISVRDAARACGMSSSLFMSFFKEATGETFLAHLNLFRITRAQALLLTTDQSVSRIAQEAGYSDHSHFGVAFRKAVGMSPLVYRHRFSPENPCLPEPREIPGLLPHLA